MAITKIGTPELFDFSATNTALQLPAGDTASRPTSPSTGEWRYNTTDNRVEYYDGAAWFRIEDEAIPGPVPVGSEHFNTNTYFGNGATQTIDAKFNEAANFNGSSSYIIIQDGGIGNNGTARVSFSVSIWVNTESTSNSGIISDYDGLDYSFYLQMNASGTLNIGNYMDGVGSFTSGTATINDGNWHNLVLINNTSDNTQKLFVDGNSTPDINHTLTSGTKNAVPIQVGYYTISGGVNFLKGKLDQIRFFNAPIIASDITALYSNETTTTAATLNFPVGAGCVAAYQLDGNGDDISTPNYNGTTTNIGYTGLKFQPDLIWLKGRNNSNIHILTDSIRGTNSQLSSNNTGAETTYSSNITAFNSNGFTLGSATDTNGGSETYVAWCWYAPTAQSIGASGSRIASTIKKNVDAGFSIVSWTGLGNNGQTVGHGLGAAPELIITKVRNISGESWYTYSAETGNTKFLNLNTTAEALTAAQAGYGGGTNFWNDTSPTNSVFSLGSIAEIKSYNHVAYCFHSIVDYQKIGIYAGNLTTPPSITTGFSPSFLMIKKIDNGTGPWIIIDSKRAPTNPASARLRANTTDIEYSNSSEGIYRSATGFTVGTVGNLNTWDGMNANSTNYLYLAIA